MTTVAPTAGPAGHSRPAIAAWCLFDWANSAFNTVIGTFVFSVYFARGIVGDETAGSALWAQAMAVSAVLIAVLSPVLGAIADRAGRRKPWVALFVALCVVPTCLLWFAGPDPSFLWYALALAVVASVGHELSQVFANAMLTTVAPQRMLGRVSGWAWGLGYLGGLACLATALFALIGLGDTPPLLALPTGQSEHVRASALLVAAWFAVFSLPLFVLVREGGQPTTPLRRAVGEGLRQLKDTVRRLPRHGQVLRFLIASALYRDGLSTLFTVGGLYAAGTFGMGFDQLLVFAIGLNVTAGLGAFGFAFVDDRSGSKLTILIALAGLIAVGIPILLVTEAGMFIALALVLGIFVGPAQAASRTLMARLSPQALQTEFFGLYALTGKAVAFLGPTAFAVVTATFDSQRAGMATILVFWTVGALVLLTVREPVRERTPDV